MKKPRTCWIYRSNRKDEMYLYLCEESDFSPVPEALMQLFGQPQFVMTLMLDPARKLARADVQQVVDNLDSHGFYLQMPPKLVPELYHGNDC